MYAVFPATLAGTAVTLGAVAAGDAFPCGNDNYLLITNADVSNSAVFTISNQHICSEGFPVTTHDLTCTVAASTSEAFGPFPSQLFAAPAQILTPNEIAAVTATTGLTGAGGSGTSTFAQDATTGAGGYTTSAKLTSTYAAGSQTATISLTANAPAAPNVEYNFSMFAKTNCSIEQNWQC